MIPPSMEYLVQAAAMSRCAKSKRGVVLVSKNEDSYFFGANWPASGTCDGSEECRRDCAKICVHAEQVALLSAGTAARGSEIFHLKVVDGKPVESKEPSCVECSKLMLQAGVAKVWLYTKRGWTWWSALNFHLATLRNLKLHEGA